MNYEKDYYSTLGVAKDANLGTIKKAYRTLALELHPDRTGGDKIKEERFKDISEAYQVLENEDLRYVYDHNFRLGGHEGAAKEASRANRSVNESERTRQTEIDKAEKEKEARMKAETDFREAGEKKRAAKAEGNATKAEAEAAELAAYMKQQREGGKSRPSFF